MHAIGWRDIEVLKMSTRVREAAKVCKLDVFSETMEPFTAPTCDFDMNKMTDYIDPVWKFNLGHTFLSVFDLPEGWYGEKTWWSI